VFVLVPGATYSREYWDFQYQPDTYSFSRALAQRGYATFAIDRLGTGQSSHPLSLTITDLVQVDAVHQVITRLRAAGFDGHPFSRILLAGHSLGSALSIVASGTFHDVDGLVVTGSSHRVNPIKLTQILSDGVHPAIFDPQFVGMSLDPGYLTTRPGTRKESFHDPGIVDPAVIERDEATKDVTAATEIPDAVALGELLSYSDRVTAPVLLAVGGEDTVFCGGLSDCSSAGTLLAQEQPYYANAACLSAFVMAGAGHAMNLHPTAPIAQTRVADWADATADGSCPQ